MKRNELFEFLETKVYQYNSPDFIKSDPIRIPHSFSRKEDIEIAGFLTASIAWGSRPLILKSAEILMQRMGEEPFSFVMESECPDEKQESMHRTFMNTDFWFFVKSLRNIYMKHGGLESLFTEGFKKGSAYDAISYFRVVFFSIDHPERTLKHIAEPAKGSAAKRINMFLRWMVRNDNKGVDFGLWKNISPSELSIPLDLHTARIARMLGLLERKQNDWKAVRELDLALRSFDPQDPVKYDYALFGTGVFDKL